MKLILRLNLKISGIKPENIWHEVGKYLAGRGKISGMKRENIWDEVGIKPENIWHEAGKYLG